MGLENFSFWPFRIMAVRGDSQTQTVETSGLAGVRGSQGEVNGNDKRSIKGKALTSQRSIGNGRC
jgi:hypothetical protein